MTTSDVRRIIEEKLIDGGLNDEDALELADSIMDQLEEEGLFEVCDEESDEY